MGESAGAIAVGNLVNTTPENPLFRAAIEMSGSSVVVPIDLGGADPDLAWPALVELLNCTGTDNEQVLECVRAVPGAAIQRMLDDNGLVFSTQPHNNITSLEQPDLAWVEGNVVKVPLLIGYTADDGSYFVQEPAALATAANISLRDALVALNFPSTLADSLSAMYGPGSPYYPDIKNTQEAIYQLATDITFGCTSAFVANVTSNLLNVPVWEYRYDAVVSSKSFPGYPDLGAWHSSELALIFGTYPRENATELDARVSQSIQTQFGNFVKDPQSGPGWDQWPQVGVLGVADGNAVTTTRSVQELQPICQIYNELWLTSEVPALRQALSQTSSNASNTTNPSTGADEANLASPARQSAWSLIIGFAFLFAVVLV
jgi:carboxylesterase type B